MDWNMPSVDMEAVGMEHILQALGDMRRFVADRLYCHKAAAHAAAWHSCAHPDCREARRVQNWLQDMGQA